MMDEYIDEFLSPTLWSDVNKKECLPWVCSEFGQPNEVLSDGVGMHEVANESSPASYSVDSIAARDNILNGESEYVLDKSLLLGRTQPKINGQDYNGNSSLNGIVNGHSKVGGEVLQCDTLPNPGSLNFVSQNQLLQVGGLEGSSLSNTVSEHHRYNGSCEPSDFQSPLNSYQNFSPIPQYWPLPSYEGVFSLPPVIGEERLPDFGLPGKYVDYDTDVLGNRYTGLDKILDLDDLSASFTTKGIPESQNYALSALDAGPQITTKPYGFQSLSQVSSTNHSGSCNGTGKSRTRAPRGQATDPHSIAERLRREKISDRMKSLQELVPNSDKTDKASMLDEIINYVKFLQLQVKVLSKSRLGAAEAVIPLNTDGQAQGSNGVLQSQSPSPSTGQSIDVCRSPNQLAFEQEVLKLMESNLTMAMQHLQSKGLCLMPLAFASAISSEKGSQSAISEDATKSGSTSGGSSLAVGAHQVSPRKLVREGITTNRSNGTTKQEG